MRLFGYYAFHSVINQLKKLFKTWVLIFLIACFAIGALVGVGAAFLSDLAEEDVGETEEVLPDEEIGDQELPPAFETSVENPGTELIELSVGGILLLLFVIEALGADKNGSKIFLPADAGLLFPSPMKPQSVLLFRLLNQIGVILLSTLYLAFQIPNLVVNLGLDIWAAIGIIATWILAVAVGKLIQIALYTLASTHPGLKKRLRIGIYGFLFVVVGGFIVYSQKFENDYFAAAVGFFNHDLTRGIPLWGWLKGLCMCSIQGNVVGALIYGILTVVTGAALAFVIWHIRADFYEDALAKSQETAALQEVIQSEGAGFVKRKKDRNERLLRDGMKHGAGANVFFFRSLYNRFRFAHFKIFTKTSETYLVLSVGVSLLCIFALKSDPLLPVVLSLAGMIFFRTLGNPLEEDTSKDFFRMIPESTIKKLLWSMLAGTANCLLDLLPAVIALIILSGGKAFFAIAWIPVLLSVDFYGTNVGTFINLSVPGSAGKTVKQIVQIMFIYFGLLPDIAIMAIALILGIPILGAFLTTLVNVALGTIFLALSPLFLDHIEKAPKR